MSWNLSFLTMETSFYKPIKVLVVVKQSKAFTRIVEGSSVIS